MRCDLPDFTEDKQVVLVSKETKAEFGSLVTLGGNVRVA